MGSQFQNRDIVAIGASAGGVSAVSKLVSSLPDNFPACVLVVVHTTPFRESSLPEILTARGPLRASHPVHGEKLLRGRIYVAPPDSHLVVRPGYFHVVRGPKENGQRPSVDVLFRSAAIAYGSRVIGVVLTGYLDCGTAGILSIKARGGVAIAQDPADAVAPDMPESAIRHGDIDHVVPLDAIPSLLGRLVAEPAGEEAEVRPAVISEIEGDEPGIPTQIVCPACQGALTFAESGDFQLFRCHVGHAFSLESLALEQAEAVERALWAAARALEEGVYILRRAAASSTGDVRARLDEKAQTQAEHAKRIRQLLLAGGAQLRPDVPAARADEGTNRE